MLCISCEKEIPDGSKFCNHCGVSQTPAEKVHNTKKRGNGQGSVYRSGGKWAAEVTLGYYMENGKVKRKMRRKYGFDRKKDALAYIETLRTDKRPKKVTFSQLYEMFRTGEMAKLSQSKNTAYTIAWRKIAGELCFMSLADATVSRLQEITDKCGTSYYTKRDIKNLLSHLFRIAIRDEYADRNRAQYIILPPLESKEKTIFTEEEIDLLWSDSEDYLVRHILLMIYTGMRPGELLQILKTNVHLSEQYLTGGIKTRRGKNRKIIIPDKALSLLRALMEEAEGERVSNYRRDEFYDAWSAYKARAGLREELSPYSCRHTYITMLTALKVSPAMLQELAGHEDYDTTLEYTHLSVQDRLREVNRL